MEYLINMGSYKKGCTPYNKGKKGFNHSEETKQKIKEHNSKFWLGKKRSKETVKKISDSLRGKVGKEARNWQGGITTENKKARQTLEYMIWRNEVYKRDHYTCRICGKKCTAKTIVAHHLKLFSEFPELRYSVDNGIVLCRSCHGKIHSKKISY